MELEFKTKNPKQVEAARYWIDDTTEEILYGGAKGGGKSFLGATLIFGDALIYAGTHYFIARQELNDLVKFTVPTIHEVFQNWGISLDDVGTYNGQDKVFNLNNGSKVYLIACKETPSDPLYERFGSMQMTRGWIEEGGEIAEAAKANLWLSIGRWKNKEYNLHPKLLITANPKKGWMKRDFVDPWQKNALPPSRKFVPARATDNLYLPESYISKLSQEKDTVRRQRLWLGDWEYDEDKDSLITFDALSDTFSNTVTKDAENYITVDVARLGRDRTVVCLWEGLLLTEIHEYQRQTIDRTEQVIRDFAASKRVPFSNIIVDEDGVGGGVVDHLVGIRGFVANSSPLPTASVIRSRQIKRLDDYMPNSNYGNLKAQCGYKLAELINEHKIAFKVPDYRDVVVEELTATLKQRNVDSDGKLYLVKKEDIKSSLGKSPDIGDAILMRAYFEVKNDSLKTDPQQDARVHSVQLHQFSRNAAYQDMNSSE